MNVGAVGGEVAGEVTLIADDLSRAVELTLNPTVAHEARNQAYNACESFKENSPWCAQAGLLLASGSQYSAVVKHFGLQLMEHTVKYRWTQITQAEKIFIKENAMKLLYMGGWEIGHLNDALARVIVEMIKREWPQQWPTLLAELSDACARGHVHTQIVLHVFLRLVEDVATLQTLEQHQRRKDIYQALTSNMSEIFAFFMRLIELHVQEFREKTAAGDYNAAASNGRVVQVVLLTLTGFVEWVSTNHVVMNNGRLLQILCILLQDDAFQLPAAECLLQVVNRKGSTKERKPLMILFSDDAIACIHRATLASINAVDEQHYLFLKKLSQVLAGLSQQLTSLWAYATNYEGWLPVLLETMLLLTSHPSLTLAHTANAVWLAFLKHEHIARLPHVLAVVPRWLHASAPKVLKVTYPTSRVSGVNDAVAYACMDYDSEQEFAIFFSRCRTEILDSFRYCMSTAPLVTWAYVEQWTRAALDKVESCPPHVDVTHPLHVEWEALSQVLDVVLSRLLQAEPRPNVVEGLQLLQRCVVCSPRAPPILSLLLSLISALFVFLSCAYSQLAGPGVGVAGADLLPRVLDKIFAALVYEGAPPADR
ncbi:exportin-5-like, partial [Ostrinia furnacalis]|uniref:exportin-5-like n=1 Tax=Ostrinia furnacalis TaxID=93504 RepID=UPI00103D79A9